jgi:energy-coupling factor transporter ATP-binding protein EcfA2
MSAVITFQELEWKYENTTEFALRGVDLEIEGNSFIGIVGANEQGKTSLISAINGLIPHSNNGVYRGDVQVFGKSVSEMDALDLASKVGLVFADPESQFTAMTVEEELVFGLENMGLGISEIRERLEWAAEVTMIQDLLDKSPYDVSGGQKQRVAIACVLAMNPPIIIMDEPTSMIDPLGKQLIFDILHKLKEAGDHTLIVVEHNIEQLAPLADQMLLMWEGRVDRLAPPREFFKEPAYLAERGVLTPEVTEFAEWLRQEDYLGEHVPLPLDLEAGVEVTQEVLDAKGEYA